MENMDHNIGREDDGEQRFTFKSETDVLALQIKQLRNLMNDLPVCFGRFESYKTVCTKCRPFVSEACRARVIKLKEVRNAVKL